MTEPLSTKARGVLQLEPQRRQMQLERRAPADALRGVVEHHWIVRWDLRSQPPFLAATLPHPSVHLVTEGDGPMVHGVHTGRFSTVLEGAGSTVGVKFRAGAFYQFLRAPLATLTNRSTTLGAVFGTDGDELEDRLRATTAPLEIIALIEQLLVARLSDPDPTAELVTRIVYDAMHDRSLVSVDEMASRSGLGVRTLQRLFSRYVGVSPKWVLQRYRLHEAAERLRSESVELAELALELGYCDQAHFIKDFTAVVGRTPGSYAAAIQREGTDRAR